jgi:hypothetical protein
MDRARLGATSFRFGCLFLVLLALIHGFGSYQSRTLPTDGFSFCFILGMLATASLSLTVATRRRRDPALLRSAAVVNLLWLLPGIAVAATCALQTATAMLSLSAAAFALSWWLLPNDYY